MYTHAVTMRFSCLYILSWAIYPSYFVTKMKMTDSKKADAELPNKKEKATARESCNCIDAIVRKKETKSKKKVKKGTRWKKEMEKRGKI